MQQAMSGIRFRETMDGGIMLGEQDYRRGEQQARVAGHILAMHATVEIDDLERFLADPQHAGALSGTIDYPPFGLAIPAHSGRFNLFSPGGRAGVKRMVYELGFIHGGEPFYLAGHKEVHDDPGFDLWSDTTTLYSRLHRGESRDGEIIAAGVLSLGMTDLLKLLASMEVTHAQTLADKAGALARFGRFFLGELWDSYAGLAGE
jgi:hypothetical protein